jgi:anaerobic C4-dicarboxylate transporter
MKTFLSAFALFLFTFLVSFVAFAADIPNPLPSGLPVLGQAHGVLAGVAASSMLGSIGIVVEVLLRAIPSKKPLSVLWLIVGGIIAAITVLDQVKSVLVDLITIANKTLPAPPAPETAPAAPKA